MIPSEKYFGFLLRKMFQKWVRFDFQSIYLYTIILSSISSKTSCFYHIIRTILPKINLFGWAYNAESVAIINRSGPTRPVEFRTQLRSMSGMLFLYSSWSTHNNVGKYAAHIPAVRESEFSSSGENYAHSMKKVWVGNGPEGGIAWLKRFSLIEFKAFMNESIMWINWNCIKTRYKKAFSSLLL